MVYHPTLFTALEKKEKSHKTCPALQTTSYFDQLQSLHKTRPTLQCQYIGQISRTLRQRFHEHRRGIQNNTEESVSIHFNQSKHTLNDVQLIPIFYMNNNRDSIRLSVEQKLIEKEGTHQNGINWTCNH